MTWSRLRRALFLIVLVGLFAGGCALLRPPQPGTVSFEDRLADFPSNGMPLHADAEVRWNAHAVPYLVVDDPRDLPFLLGVVHGHLRRTQMELFLRAARGELSASGGPFAVKIDQLLRTLDIDRAVPEIVAQMPATTRAWVERYAEGVNFQAAYPRRRPFDERLLALDGTRRWTVEDTVTLGRLVSVDSTIGGILGRLQLREEPGFDDYLAQRRQFDAEGIPSFGPGQATPLGQLPNVTSTGSNSLTVAPWRSASGAALMANDPHLGLVVPSFWCLVGYRTPTGSVVGLTVPGIPAVVTGRSEHIAWGGTRMMAYASVLYDVSNLDENTFSTREETLNVRAWLDRRLTIREAPQGPILSDAAFLKDLKLPPIALRWRGHAPSDEVTPFLRVAEARTWDEFRAAWKGYAVAGLNMLFADVEGNIGQVMAMEQIPAAAKASRVLLADPDDPHFAWTGALESTELPAALNPESGYLLSANNTPFLTDPPISSGGNANDRMIRMAQLIEDAERVDLDVLRNLQQDVFLPSALEASHALVAAIPPDIAPDFLEVVTEWDGHYDRNSRGAPAYQRWLFELYETAYASRLGLPIAKAWRNSVAAHHRVRTDLERGWLTSEDVAQALRRAADPHDLTQTWGEVRRIPLQHPIGFAPVVGKWWRFGDLPGDGALGTVRKTAGPETPNEHFAFFGSHVRHLSDMSDPDENYFVFLGGQDGWIGSENIIDQAALWDRGEYIRMPLRPAEVEAAFPYSIELGLQDR